MPVLSHPLPSATATVHAVTSAEVAPAKSETPTLGEVQAYYDTIPGITSGDKVQYTTPEGVLIYYNAIGSTLVRETAVVQEYTAEPDALTFAPNTWITVRAGGVVTAYQNNAGGTAFVEGDYEGATGGGGDGNGIIREAGYVAAANEVVSYGGALWLHPTGGTVAADMATAGFVNALGGGGAEVDTLQTVTSRGTTTNTDIEFTTATSGTIYLAADGGKHRTVVNNDGSLTTVPV